MFGFYLGFGIKKIGTVCLVICCLALVVAFLGGTHWWRYMAGVFILGVSLYYSYRELDKKVHVKNVLLARINMRKNE